MEILFETVMDAAWVLFYPVFGGRSATREE
jgi:hypothetical protein